MERSENTCSRPHFQDYFIIEPVHLVGQRAYFNGFAIGVSALNSADD